MTGDFEAARLGLLSFDVFGTPPPANSIAGAAVSLNPSRSKAVLHGLACASPRAISMIDKISSGCWNRFLHHERCRTL
jgi:hypothetical protein